MLKIKIWFDARDVKLKTGFLTWRKKSISLRGNFKNESSFSAVHYNTITVIIIARFCVLLKLHLPTK